MEGDIYEQILNKLKLPISAAPHFGLIARQFSTSKDTIYSIYSQEIQARVMRSHKSLCAHAPELVARYLKGADMLDLCFEVDLPPCTVLRRMLEQLPMGFSVPKRTTEVLRDPTALHRLVSIEMAGQALADAGLDTVPPSAAALLARLESDIGKCIECDAVCGPASDLARQTAGREHETKLYDALSAAGIAYWSEDALRSRGFFKTPDARLQVPIAVNGRIVCWIDSKATFGDARTHKQQLSEQYQRYVNRFGPGMVIYWHGYLKHLEAEDQQVLLVADFPPAHAITTLPRLPLTKSLTNRIDAGTVGSSMGVPVEQAGGGQQGQT